MEKCFSGVLKRTAVKTAVVQGCGPLASPSGATVEPSVGLKALYLLLAISTFQS